MKRFVKPAVITLSSLLIAWAVYLIGWNAGHTAGVIEAITEQFKQAFRGPLPPRGKV